MLVEKGPGGFMAIEKSGLAVGTQLVPNSERIYLANAKIVFCLLKAFVVN